MILLRVEMIGGTHITEAVREAKIVALQLHCMVQFTFNGIELHVTDGTDVDGKVAEYEHERELICAATREGEDSC